MKGMSSKGAPVGRTILFAIACVSLSLSLSGCGKTAKPTNIPATTSTTLSSGDAEILDAYRQFQQDYLAVGATMNVDDPRLSAHATGAELAQLRKTFIGLKLDGDVIAGTITVSPTLLSSSGDTATIRDCSVDAGRTVKAATGVVVGDASVRNELTTVTMTRVDGTWKVFSIHHDGTGCAPSS